MKRLLFAAALLSCLLTGCAAGNTAETSSASADTAPTACEPVEYKTVTPPKGGWSTAEIMDVTYLCDKQLTYPLSVSDLGSDFSVSGYSRLGVGHRIVPGNLNYKKKKLANVSLVKPHDEIMIYNLVLLPSTVQVEDVTPFVINGVKMNATMDECIAALGEGYSYKSDHSLMYDDRETKESLYSLFFENGRLVHLNIAFRFDIDLPLYRDNDRR